APWRREALIFWLIPVIPHTTTAAPRSLRRLKTIQTSFVLLASTPGIIQRGSATLRIPRRGLQRLRSAGYSGIHADYFPSPFGGRRPCGVPADRAGFWRYGLCLLRRICAGQTRQESECPVGHDRQQEGNPHRCS